MGKIYLVTEGEYEDYRVLEAFTSLEKASDYKKRLEIVGQSYEDFHLEEMETDPEPFDFVRLQIYLTSKKEKRYILVPDYDPKEDYYSVKDGYGIITVPFSYDRQEMIDSALKEYEQLKKEQEQ